MAKIVVGVDGSSASKAGLEWCARNASTDDDIVAVCGVSEAGEFVINLPGFDDSTSVAQIKQTFRTRWCEPLRRAGLRWRSTFIAHSHPVALAEVIDREDPDLVVVGKPTHVGFDVVLRGKLQHALQHAHCPVLVVPEDRHRARPATTPSDDLAANGA